MGAEYPRSVFPDALDKRGAGGSLLEAPNASTSFIPAGRLAVGVSAEALTFKVIGIDLFRVPSQGLVTVGDELVRYSSKNEALNEIYVDNVSLRGYAGTEPAPHTIGTQVLWMLTNEHLASIQAAVEATQAHIGVKGSTDPNSIEYRLRNLTDGVMDGDLAQIAVEVTQAHIDSKSLTLPAAVKSIAGVVVFVVNGGAQENGVDFAVAGTNPAVVMWAGLSLDGLLAVGDKLLVLYEQA